MYYTYAKASVGRREQQQHQQQPTTRKSMSLRKKTKKKCSHCGNDQGKLKYCTGCRPIVSR
jgi:hypothetical protein